MLINAVRFLAFLALSLFANNSRTWAQPATIQVSSPVTANVYAQQQIDLLAGFEATTGGFEAKIKLPEVTAGRSPRHFVQLHFIR